MPNDDSIPTILAVADSLALSSGLTDLQRDEALQAIELFRDLTPIFLDSAEKLIQEGATSEGELIRTATQGTRLVTNLTKICQALWALEDTVFSLQAARIAKMGKENTKHEP